VSVTYRCPRRVRGQRCCSCPACCTVSGSAAAPAPTPGAEHPRAGRAGVALVVRDTRRTQLARDNGIGISTAYDYRDEAITVLTARKPSLHGVLLAANAGHTHVIVDGTLIYTDRNHAPGPRPGVDLLWSANTTITAGTSRSSPPRTAGRCGPPRCALVVSTTPPPPAPTPTCSTRSSLGRRRPARPGRPRLRRRGRDPPHPDQEDCRPRPDL
jgi:hypothetical protein